LLIPYFVGHEVTHIDWSLISRDPRRLPDKVRVEICKRPQQLLQGVSSATQQQQTQKHHQISDASTMTAIFADYVICTMPLGYLKMHHDTIFQPKLDDRKVTPNPPHRPHPRPWPLGPISWTIGQ
jgi:hypothetical protein